MIFIYWTHCPRPPLEICSSYASPSNNTSLLYQSKKDVSTLIGKKEQKGYAPFWSLCPLCLLRFFVSPQSVSGPHVWTGHIYTHVWGGNERVKIGNKNLIRSCNAKALVLARIVTAVCYGVASLRVRQCYLMSTDPVATAAGSQRWRWWIID